MIENIDELNRLIQNELKPLVKRIDTDAYYPEDFLKKLGKLGFLNSKGLPGHTVFSREVRVVEEVAKVCMTTAFNLWCHLASLTYIRRCENAYLKEEILPLLENGGLLGGTGLSNPMKYYAGLETLHLKAKRTKEGYIVSGKLPAVSNLGLDHWFGIIAEADDNTRIMALVPCDADGLKLKEKLEYLGVNGSATYTCSFNEVTIPDKWIVAHEADDYIKKIRPAFVLYQIPLGLGVTEASVVSIRQVCNKQGGCNQYISLQPDDLQDELQKIRDDVYRIIDTLDLKGHWNDLLQLRLRIAYLTSKATHACMLHQGGAGYLQNSAPSRRLRESYFLVNLTPTVKHLEKMIRQ